jgi:hypothetical protein
VFTPRDARAGLAAVRLVNGILGLLAPGVLIKRVDPDAPPSPAAIYAFRMFGIRTIVLGIDLLVCPEADIQRSLRKGVVIHGSDVATAALLGLRRRVPPRTAVLLTAISLMNVALALIGMKRRS